MALIDEQLKANLQGDFDTGWKIAQQLEREQPECNRAAFNRGWHLLQQGMLQEGMALIDRGRFENVFGSPPLQSPASLWRGVEEDISGKTVLLRGEGGLGDEIINLRFAKDLADRGAKVVVACDASLKTLFMRQEGVSAVVERGAEMASCFDYWVPGMSAVRLCGYTYETLSGKPYLKPLPDRVEKWKQIVKPGKFNIGIRWSGLPKFEHEQFRRFPEQPMIDLHKLEGAQIYSLQRDDNTKMLPPEIVDLQNLITSWEETAAAISNMDLVISSCTSVAHLSASMGKPTWVIVPILPYYIWALPGETSPWYDTVRLFRQQAFGNWTHPLAIMQEEVKKLVEK